MVYSYEWVLREDVFSAMNSHHPTLDICYMSSPALRVVALWVHKMLSWAAYKTHVGNAVPTFV